MPSKDQLTGLSMGRMVTGLGQERFPVHGIAVDGKALVRRQLRWSEVLVFFQSVPPCLFGTAHHRACEIKALRHTVKLMTPT